MANTDDFEKMERDGWANPAIAKGYADGFEYATREVAKRLADRIEAAPGRSVLDVCCGHGVVTQELVVRGATATGLDFSDAMIALANESACGATFVTGDAMAMEFPDAHFDAVTIGFGVPHLPDPKLGLAEVARVLKPGGRLAFSIWQGKGSAGSFGWLFDAVGRLGDMSVKLPAGPDAHLLADRAIATEMVTAAGFAEVQMQEVATEFWISEPGALYDVFYQGAVRAALLLGSQPIEMREAIREDLAKRVLNEGTKDSGGYRVPAPCVVISATRA